MIPAGLIPALIVEYKNPDALQRCIDSLPTEAMACIYSNTEENIGYVAAMNKLLTDALKSDAIYALVLNQDIQLQPGAIANAVRFMDEHPRCAIGGFKLLDSANPDRITHGGTGYAFPGGEHIQGLVSRGDCDQSRKFGWVNLGAAIVRLDALREIGLYDEHFFLVGSDSDLCYRARLKKWEVWYIATAAALHDTDGCALHPNPEQEKIITKDMTYWGHKWSTILRLARE